MTVVDNVRALEQQKSKMSSVNIEQVDESWALKLLNECEMDELEESVAASESKVTSSVKRPSTNVAEFAAPSVQQEHDDVISIETTAKHQAPIEPSSDTVNSDTLDLHSIHIEVDEDDDYVLSEDAIDAALLSLSAIEIQKLALAEQQAKANTTQTTGFWGKLFR